MNELQLQKQLSKFYILLGKTETDNNLILNAYLENKKFP